MDDKSIQQDISQEPTQAHTHDAIAKANRPRTQKSATLLAWVAIFLALGALGLTTQKLATTETTQKQQAATLNQIQQTLTQLTKTNQQRAASEALSQKQLQSILHEQRFQTSDWHIQKAHYLLELAQINHQWTNDSQTTATLLTQAETLLNNIPNPTLEPLRQAITQNLVTIQHSPTINTEDILLKLQAIQNQIPLLPPKTPYEPSQSRPLQNTSATTWHDYLSNTIQQLQRLVIIRRQDDSFLTPLTPDHVTLLRDALWLNIQQANIGVIEHQQTIFSTALCAALDIIARGFDQNNPQTQTLITTLEALRTITLSPPKPTLINPLPLLDAFLQSTETHS